MYNVRVKGVYWNEEVEIVNKNIAENNLLAGCRNVLERISRLGYTHTIGVSDITSRTGNLPLDTWKTIVRSEAAGPVVELSVKRLN